MKTEQMPAITIATVTYNAVGTLARTLQSVAAQDYPNIEHLIVDGRSTDGTLSLVQRYVEDPLADLVLAGKAKSRMRGRLAKDGKSIKF